MNVKALFSKVVKLVVGNPRELPVLIHPTEPTLYFGKYEIEDQPELEFNETRYYENNFHLVSETPLSAETVREELLGRALTTTRAGCRGSVMDLGDGKPLPPYIPFISDFDGYFHNGVSVFLRWYLTHEEIEEGVVVPKLLTPIFDLKPKVNLDNIRIYSTPTQERQIFFGATTNAIHVMKMQQPMLMVILKVHGGCTQNRGRRYYWISISGEAGKRGGIWATIRLGSVVMCWNARYIHRPSCKTNFKKLCERFCPTVVLVTEARAKSTQLDEVLKAMGNKYKVLCTWNTGVGGVALFWKKKVKPYFTQRASTLIGYCLGAEILAGETLEEGLPYTSEYTVDD